MGFLLSVLKTIGRCCTSGRFPRRRRLVPPAPAARFPQNSILAAQKHFGSCYWGHEKPLRGHALPRFSSHKLCFFSYGKSLGRVLGNMKSPCGKHAASHPGFGGGPVSNPVPPGCVVRVPTHWAICAPFRWRVPSKGAPFPTLEPIGVHLFRHGNLRFLTHNGALGAKMGANESYGRRVSF